MNIFATFEHSIEVEIALTELENQWIPREQILVVFMENEPSPAHLQARKKTMASNAFEVGMACATGSAVIGASFGFILSWGPIIWGLIATIFGFSAGFFLFYFLKKKGIRPYQRTNGPAILVIVQCTENLVGQVTDLMWQYKALTVGQAEEPS
ncbi:hypothetical protein [Paenibacillus silviterrae]|uniref:hypothetical protein n=1 Tax=Paenibacillus silviterrae TaxID=3242194 RepID=UPI002542DEAD|nr:hypothetical protein [Paenibacillus chinjuensis]